MMRTNLVYKRAVAKSPDREPDVSGCPNPVPLVRDEVDVVTGEVLDSRAHFKPCGRKGCSYCGPKLRRRLVAHFVERFTNFAAEGYALRFVTYTLDPSISDADGVAIQPDEEARAVMQEVHRKNVARLRYRTSDLAYVVCTEETERGYAHLHALVAVRWDEDWRGAPSGWQEEEAVFRQCWFASGGGAVMDCKRVQAANDGAMGDDGRPDTLAGAVGWCISYALKNSRPGERDVKCSDGLGYYAKEAVQRRQEHAEANAASSCPDNVNIAFAPRHDPAEAAARRAERALRRRRSRQPDDRPRRSLDDFDLAGRTRLYRQKLPDGRWRVHRADGAHATFNRWPGNGGAELLDASPEWSAAQARAAAED